MAKQLRPTSANRIFRTSIQLIAAGALTGVANAVVDLSPGAAALVTAVSTLLVTVASNVSADLGWVKDGRR